MKILKSNSWFWPSYENSHIQILIDKFLKTKILWKTLSNAVSQIQFKGRFDPCSLGLHIR
jgi:hypothetical protein